MSRVALILIVVVIVIVMVVVDGTSQNESGFVGSSTPHLTPPHGRVASTPISALVLMKSGTVCDQRPCPQGL